MNWTNETMNKEEEIVQYRLKVLQLAESLGNVSEACKRLGMKRTQFYKYKRRYEKYGLEGLKNLPPIHKFHPKTTSSKIEKKILSISHNHPQWGCYRISNHSKTKGISVSGPTIQKILTKNDLGTQYQRALKLQEKWFTEKITLTDEQISFIEKINPCFREKHIESTIPGGLLVHDIFSLGTYNDIGDIYMQVVVDIYCSYTFTYIHAGKTPEDVTFIIINNVLPQYRVWKIPIKTILTSDCPEFYGDLSHPYERLLTQLNIDHIAKRFKRTQINGFVQHFYITIMDELLQKLIREWTPDSIQILFEEVNNWVRSYNYERPLYGYRNMGNMPIDLINRFINSI
jgi:transposase